MNKINKTVDNILIIVIDSLLLYIFLECIYVLYLSFEVNITSINTILIAILLSCLILLVFIFKNPKYKNILLVLSVIVSSVFF